MVVNQHDEKNLLYKQKYTLKKKHFKNMGFFLKFMIAMFVLLGAAEYTNATCVDRFDNRGIQLKECAFVDNDDIVFIQNGLKNCEVSIYEESQCPFIVRDSA